MGCLPAVWSRGLRTGLGGQVGEQALLGCVRESRPGPDPNSKGILGDYQGLFRCSFDRGGNGLESLTPPRDVGTSSRDNEWPG